MSNPILLPRYTFGVGDRFAHEAEAQVEGYLHDAPPRPAST